MLKPRPLYGVASCRMESYSLIFPPSLAVPGLHNSRPRDGVRVCGADPPTGAAILGHSAPVAEQLAGRRAGALAFFKNWLAVDHDPAVPFATPNPTPFVGRNIVQDFLRQRF